MNKTILLAALLAFGGCTNLPTPEENGVIPNPGKVTPTNVERVASHPAATLACQTTQVAVFAIICGPCAAFVPQSIRASGFNIFTNPAKDVICIERERAIKKGAGFLILLVVFGVIAYLVIVKADADYKLDQEASENRPDKD